MLDGGVYWSSGKWSVDSVQSILLAGYEHGFCGRGYQAVGLHYPRQTHSTKLTVTNSSTFFACDDPSRTVADAVFTQQRKTKIAVRTADCVPLLAVADDFALAVHAGWRGLFAGILANCAHKLADYGLHACRAKWVIGPAICGFNYEVSDDFVEMFLDAELSLTREQALTCISRGERRWHLDLQLACVYGLLNLNVAAKSIEVIRICTYANHDKFYSYRSYGARTGSNWSYVCL